MSWLEVILAMSGGNPGAIIVCIELLARGEKVDSDTFDGGINSLLILDRLGIYGERIYLLWNDVCRQHIGKMIAVLRAYQLGRLAAVNTETINHAIDNRGAGIDLDAVVEAVKSRLPNFNPDVSTA